MSFILTKFHFLQFQKWPKINFWTGKKCKTAKNAISRKTFLIYLISRGFFAWSFFFDSLTHRVTVFQENSTCFFKFFFISKCIFWNYFRLHGEIMSKYLLVQGGMDSMHCICMVTEEMIYGLMMQNFFKYFGMRILMKQLMDLQQQYVELDKF